MTQTEESDNLATLLCRRPNFNPLSCAYVRPRLSMANNFKIEKDDSITIDFLRRGVPGFGDLKEYIQTNIMSMITEIHKFSLTSTNNICKMYPFLSGFVCKLIF